MDTGVQTWSETSISTTAQREQWPRERATRGLWSCRRTARVFGARADEDDALVVTSLGERRVLGKKPVAGMHAIATAGLCNLNQHFDVQVGANRIARCAERTRFGGDARMERQRVYRGVDVTVWTPSADAARRRGSNFTSIGNQYSLEQDQLTLSRRRGRRTGIPKVKQIGRERRNFNTFPELWDRGGIRGQAVTIKVKIVMPKLGTVALSSDRW